MMRGRGPEAGPRVECCDNDMGDREACPGARHNFPCHTDC